MGEGSYDLGMVGLGTMGHSLLLNFADHGYSIIGFDTAPEKAATLQGTQYGGRVHAVTDPKEFVAAIRKPRAILILVPAGAPVDIVIQTLSPYLEENDFLIDGGNSYYKDTTRRATELTTLGLGYMGMGISGGESGARHGPSMMPGGRPEDYERVRPLLESVAAKFEGEPCVALVGARSAGHYVKMVHNGIEYGIMQLIAETYDLMRRGMGMSNSQIADAFEEWNRGELQSFLAEITATVLRQLEGEDHLIDKIRDRAKQKGTGKWTSQDAMDLGIPIPTIDVAVAAREMSASPERPAIVENLGMPIELDPPDLDLEELRDSLYLGYLLAYTEGLSLLSAASKEYGLDIDLQAVARVWRAGCIIRSHFLEIFRAEFANSPSLPNLLLSPRIGEMIRLRHEAFRQTVCAFAAAAIPAPCFGASLAYLDSMRSARLPTNITQAQRDFFGAHTYERIDREGTFHTAWGQE